MGYWIFSVEDNEPFPDPPKNDNHGQRFYLKRLVKWAQEFGLKIMLDIHAAPGSQNGFDNSGRMGPIGKVTFEILKLGSPALNMVYTAHIRLLYTFTHGCISLTTLLVKHYND